MKPTNIYYVVCIATLITCGSCTTSVSKKINSYINNNAIFPKLPIPEATKDTAYDPESGNILCIFDTYPEINDSTMVDMYDILNMPIDSFYIFHEKVTNYEISNVIGIELPFEEYPWPSYGWSYVKQHIVCLYQNKIILNEKFNKSAGLGASSIIFNDTDTIFMLTDDMKKKWPYKEPPASISVSYTRFASSKIWIKRVRYLGRANSYLYNVYPSKQ